jgi:hypothetical protein
VCSGFVRVLQGVAEAGFGAARGRQPAVAYLLEHMDASRGKACLGQLYQYLVGRPFDLRGGPARTSAIPQTLISPRLGGVTCAPSVGV